MYQSDILICLNDDPVENQRKKKESDFSIKVVHSEIPFTFKNRRKMG